MILDTNAVSDLVAGNAELLRHLRSSRDHSLPTIVLGEYRYGLARSRLRSELQTWLARLEREMEILEVNSATAQSYASVKEELRVLGRPIPENDIWIAALARQHGLALLSRDTHFDFVAGLVRIGW